MSPALVDDLIVDRQRRAGESGDWDDVLRRGPGWVPFDPDVFMKEPTDPKKPMAIVERPCPASP